VNPNIDAFALALAQATDLRLFKLGIRLASNPVPLSTVATQKVTAAGFADFDDLVESDRARLEAAGVDVTTIAAGRWAAGQGADYLRIALRPGRDADTDAVSAALASVTDQKTYLDVLTAGVPVIVELDARRAAAGIIADISKRAATFKDESVQGLAPAVAGLQDLAPVDAVIAAIATSATSAPAAEMAGRTSVVRSFVDAKVAGAATIPLVLAQHGAAIGYIDLDQAPWLLGHGAKIDDVRSSVAARIKTEPVAVIAPALDPLSRGRLRGAWQIGKALVERAASSPIGSRDEWLLLAENWSVPPSKGQRQNRDDYEAALSTAAADDPAAQATAARLRAKL
jgi:hypothetical protein